MVDNNALKIRKVADWLMKGGHGDTEDDVDIDSETGEVTTHNHVLSSKHACLRPN